MFSSNLEAVSRMLFDNFDFVFKDWVWKCLNEDVIVKRKFHCSDKTWRRKLNYSKLDCFNYANCG